jgi:hypothetical protein
MDLALRQQDIDFLPEYIVDHELEEFVEVIEKHMSCSSLGNLILQSCKKTKKGHRPTASLKKSIDAFVRSFPEAELAQESLECEARVEYDFNQRRSFGKKNMFKGPTNDEIERMWRTKRAERREKQAIILSASICLKRKGLPSEIISEHISKRMKN